MPRLTTAALAALGGRDYIMEIKHRLRNDEAWLELLDPALVDRTRWGLSRLIESLDDQLERAEEPSEDWVRRVTALRRYAATRLAKIAPSGLSSTKEAKAWRAFGAKLAGALEESDPDVLHEIKTPYGALSAAQWLAVRREKRGEGA